MQDLTHTLLTRTGTALHDLVVCSHTPSLHGHYWTFASVVANLCHFCQLYVEAAGRSTLSESHLKLFAVVHVLWRCLLTLTQPRIRHYGTSM